MDFCRAAGNLNGRFIDRDPNAIPPIPGTRVEAAFLNSLLDELVINLIQASGQEPSSTDNAQIQKAIKYFFNTWKEEQHADDYWKIGTTQEMTSIVLPEGYIWPDGSLILFSEHERFHQKYLDGGFEGFVLPTDATEEEIENNPRKFVLSLDENGVPNGLYAYRLENLFPRYSINSELVGTKNNAGLPEIIGGLGATRATILGAFVSAGASDMKSSGAALGENMGFYANFKASLSNKLYGASDAVMVDSFNQPVALYLG